MTDINLANSHLSDSEINAIWVKFADRDGRTYRAIHVFNHCDGPYVLLIDYAKMAEPFENIIWGLAANYPGLPLQISDRGGDCCCVVEVYFKFTQRWIAEKVVDYFMSTYHNVEVEAVYSLGVEEAYALGGASWTRRNANQITI